MIELKEKDRYFRLEFFLTVFLLFLVISLLGEALSNYSMPVIFGLICGFCFSWFSRKGPSPLIQFIINLGTLGAFFWIIYSIMNSSLFYSDVVLICIKGVFILEVIFGFCACLPGFLTYIQVLSIPLFMSYPVLVKDYNEISAVLTLGYIICWFAILRTKLYGFFKPAQEKRFRRYHSVYLSAIFFLITVSLSWVLFSSLPMAKIRKGGFLPQEGLEIEAGFENLEKEYYDLQNRIQGDIARLIPAFKSTEERYESLALLNSLIKESPDIIEVIKAENGLISYIDTPGLGLEKKEGEELTFIIKDYLDKKILLNLKKIKESVMDVLKKNAFSIRERISILTRVNKMQRSNRYQQLRKHDKELRKTIDNSSVNADAKRELKKLTRQFKEWKAFEIYRQNSAYLEKNIDSLDAQSKKEFTALLLQIDAAQKVPEFRKIEDKIERIKEATASSQLKGLAEETDEFLDLKLEMLLSEKNREIRKKLEDSNLADYKLKELNEWADAIKDIEDSREFLENIARFKQRLKEEKADISREMKELVEIKMHLIIKEKKEKIRDVLEKSILSADSMKGVLNDLRKLESAVGNKDVFSRSKKLEAEIEKFSNQGFILKEAKDKIIRDIEDIKDLLLFKFKEDKETTGKEGLKDEIQVDYQKTWEELLEESSLSQERKEALKRLTEEILKTQTLSEVQDIKEAAEREIKASAKEGAKKEDLEKLKDSLGEITEAKRMFLLEKELSTLRKTIEELKKTSPQEAKRLEEYLNKIRQSTTAEQLKREIDNLKEYLQSKTQELASYQKTWEELLEESSLSQERKEALKRLTEEILKTQTLSEVQDIKEAAEREIKASAKEGAKKEDLEKLKDSLGEITEAKRMFLLEKELPTLRKTIEERKPKEQKLKSKLEKAEEEASWQIYILPYYLVIPIDTYVPLKTIAIYNKMFIKELSSDLEWFSSNPYVAWVDEKSTVHSLSKGKAKISAKYKGISSQEAEVTVVDKISEATDRAIKKEVAK